MVPSLLLEGFTVQQGPRTLSSHLLCAEKKPHQTICPLRTCIVLEVRQLYQNWKLYTSIRSDRTSVYRASVSTFNRYRSRSRGNIQLTPRHLHPIYQDPRFHPSHRKTTRDPHAPKICRNPDRTSYSISQGCATHVRYVPQIFGCASACRMILQRRLIAGLRGTRREHCRARLANQYSLSICSSEALLDEGWPRDVSAVDANATCRCR